MIKLKPLCAQLVEHLALAVTVKLMTFFKTLLKMQWTKKL